MCVCVHVCVCARTCAPSASMCVCVCVCVCVCMHAHVHPVGWFVQSFVVVYFFSKMSVELLLRDRSYRRCWRHRRCPSWAGPGARGLQLCITAFLWTFCILKNGPCHVSCLQGLLNCLFQNEARGTSIPSGHGLERARDPPKSGSEPLD